MKDDRNELLRKLGIGVVSIHLIIAIAHGQGHDHLSIGLNAFENAFVYGVIVTAPIIAAIMLWRRMLVLGHLALFLSMAGSCIFGIYKHYIEMSPDHYSQIPGGMWGSIFSVTAILLAVSETAGEAIGAIGLAVARTAKTTR